MRYRIVYIAYRIDGKLEYMYFDYMMQVGGALRGILKNAVDWHVEVLGADNEYHPITTVYDEEVE